MKLKSMEELSVFNDLLNACCGMVWIESETGERYDLNGKTDRFAGLSKLLGEHADKYDVYAQTREDKMLLFHYMCGRAAQAA